MNDKQKNDLIANIIIVSMITVFLCIFITYMVLGIPVMYN